MRPAQSAGPWLLGVGSRAPGQPGQRAGRAGPSGPASRARARLAGVQRVTLPGWWHMLPHVRSPPAPTPRPHGPAPGRSFALTTRGHVPGSQSRPGRLQPPLCLTGPYVPEGGASPGHAPGPAAPAHLRAPSLPGRSEAGCGPSGLRLAALQVIRTHTQAREPPPWGRTFQAPFSRKHAVISHSLGSVFQHSFRLSRTVRFRALPPLGLEGPEAHGLPPLRPHDAYRPQGARLRSVGAERPAPRPPGVPAACLCSRLSSCRLLGETRAPERAPQHPRVPARASRAASSSSGGACGPPLPPPQPPPRRGLRRPLLSAGLFRLT